MLSQITQHSPPGLRKLNCSMSLTIIAIGKKHESWVSEGIERYQKRLKQPYNVEWILLPHSSFEGNKARQEESDRISGRLSGFDFTIVLDERGRMIDSPQLAGILDDPLAHSQKIAIVIGGAYGITEELRQQVRLVWSLSPLVLPHQLVRLILIEQLYRVQKIATGGSYHHE